MTVTTATRRAMLAKIHIAKKDLGLDDDTYRAMLDNLYGVESSAKLSPKQLDDLLGHLTKHGFAAKKKGDVAPSDGARNRQPMLDKIAALDDRWRVRVDRVWYAPDGLKYAFLPLAEALTVAGWPRQDDPRPDIGHGDRRRLWMGSADDGSVDLYASVVCMTDPWQGPDGRWRVFIVGRREPVLVNELERYGVTR